MTRDEAVALMQVVLGFRSDQASTIISFMQLAQTQLEKAPTKPWWLLSEDSYADTTADEQRIVIPTDFLLEADLAVIRYVPDDADGPEDEIDLKKDSYDVLRNNFRQTVPGPPEAYALTGGYFRIFPTPDDVYRLHMLYYKADTLLTTNVENNWLKYSPKLLMGKAGLEIAGALRDSNAMEIFGRWEQEDTLLTAANEVAREQANSDAQVGGPHV